MPTKKRAKKQPGAAPAATAKPVFKAARSKRKRRPGRARKKVEPVPIVAEVKINKEQRVNITLIKLNLVLVMQRFHLGTSCEA